MKGQPREWPSMILPGTCTQEPEEAHTGWMLESTNTCHCPNKRQSPPALLGHWQPSVCRLLFTHLRHFYKCLNNFYHLSQFPQDTQAGMRFRLASFLPNQSTSRCKVCIYLVGHVPREQLGGWKSRAILKECGGNFKDSSILITTILRPFNPQCSCNPSWSAKHLRAHFHTRTESGSTAGYTEVVWVQLGT